MHFQWEENAFPAIGDAAYRKHVGEGQRHGHLATFTKKLVKIAHVVLEISCQTDRQTHRQTYLSQYFAISPAGEVTMKTTAPTAAESAATVCYGSVAINGNGQKELTTVQGAVLL